MAKLLWLVSGFIYLWKCLYRSATKTDLRRPLFQTLNCTEVSRGWSLVQFRLSCSTKDLRGVRKDFCQPQGFRAGTESRTAAGTHLPGASEGTSWVSCCSSPSWPSLFQSLPKNCYVPVDRCAKQRDLTFGSAKPFSLFYTRGRKRSQVVEILLLFLSQTEINYSKAWISSETLKPTPHMHYPWTGLHLNISIFLFSCNTTTLTKLFCWAQGNLAFHSSQGKTNILSRIINTDLGIVK